MMVSDFGTLKKTAVLNSGSGSYPLVQFGEILKQVQNDISKKFQIYLDRNTVAL